MPWYNIKLTNQSLHSFGGFIVAVIAPIDKVQSKPTALCLVAGVKDRLWFLIRKMIWQEEQSQTCFVNGVKKIVKSIPLWLHYFKSEALEAVKAIKTTHEIHCDYTCRMPLDRRRQRSKTKSISIFLEPSYQGHSRKEDKDKVCPLIA